MAGLTFVYLHRVPYSLCTLGNHVYYSRYLDILETARGEFFRELGTTFQQWQEGGTIFPVVECRLKYKSPARYDDLLRVELRITTAEGARLNFGYRIYNQADVLIVEAETLHVCAGLGEKPKRLPAELKDKLLPYVSSPEEQQPA